MDIKKIKLISFSPTGTSKKIIHAIAASMSDIPCESIDLTYPGEIKEVEIGPDELVILGVPVYAGRVPALAAERLASLKGDNNPAILVVTYGNREYEDALVELKDFAIKAGMVPVAGGAFIGEHSFSAPEQPIAEGRPDQIDLKAAERFAKEVMAKVNALESLAALQPLNVPGDVPYKEGMGPLPFTPAINEERCTECGECVESCPTGAVTLEQGLNFDKELCIFCCACIKDCPEEALAIGAEPLKQKRQWLSENCNVRKEPELFL